MVVTQFIAAINQLCEEKGLPLEKTLEIVEMALAAAYRKDYGNPRQKIKAKLDLQTNEMKFFILKEVVEEVKNKEAELTLEEARKIKKKAKLGDILELPIESHNTFGRIAAQTAKQVIIQRIRELEKELLFNEFKEKEGTLINGYVQQIEGKNIIVNLGRANGILFASEQIPGERFTIGQRIKVYLLSVEQTVKGPQIVVSRSHPNFIKNLFEFEVPEITSGSVEIKSVAREAGFRSKIAVVAHQEGVDPVGSCVGQRGTRVQAVLTELGEEKIDIILWDEDPVKFIANALSPAKIEKVTLDEKNKKAIAEVTEEQVSLAIGKGGQNVRLAAKLTGWNIDIVEKTKEGKEKVIKIEEDTTVKVPVKDSVKDKVIEDLPGIGKVLAAHLKEAGFDTIEKIAQASIEDLTKIKGCGKTMAEKLIKTAKTMVEELKTE